MAEIKYANNLMDLKPGFTRPSHEGKVAHLVDFHQGVFEDATVFCSVYMFYKAGAGLGWGEVFSMPWIGKNFHNTPHYHADPEFFFFVGTDPENPGELGGEHEFWLGEGDEAEKFMITKPSVLYVPSNVVHGPNFCRKCDHPYMMIVEQAIDQNIVMGLTHIDTIPAAFVK